MITYNENTTENILFKDTDLQTVSLNNNTVFKKEEDWNGLTLTAGDNGADVSLTLNGTTGTVYFKREGQSWRDLTVSATISLSKNQKLFLARDFTSGSTSNYLNIKTLTGNIQASGNINSMIKKDDFESLTSISSYSYVFYSMFDGCTGLTQVPKLPATSLIEYCYLCMFRGCTGLTQAPELPATSLGEYCYWFMFRGCTGLTQAPELPATSLDSGCYDSMFYGCKSLNYVKAAFLTTPSSSYTSNWLYNVSSNGTFYKNVNATWDVSGTTGIPSTWTVITYDPSEETT